MEVVALNGSNNNASPFRREVHEWQHIDAKTGALLSGRAEANRYVNGNLNTYGKSLLQSFETTDGTQHKQHKQMNILQTITSTGGALQVVRAQTIQTSHSSSRRAAITSTTYSSQYTNGCSSTTANSSTMNGDLLSINPRASILHHHEFQKHAQPASTSSSSRLKVLLSSAAVSEGNSKNNLFHQSSNNNNSNSNNNSYDMDQPMMMKNGVGLIQEYSRQQQINEMLFGSTSNNEESLKSNSFLRGKSASIEELANINDSDNDDDLKPYDWKRVSKIRRSLQFPKTSERRINYSRPLRPADLPENSVNVWKLRQDIENIESGRRLSNSTMKTAISSNNTNNINFVALDSILKESSPMDSLSSNHSRSDDSNKDELKSDCVTAESLQEIRRRLRKLNSNDFISSTKLSSNDSNRLLTVDENTNDNHLTSHLQKSATVEQNCKSLELRKNKERDINADDWANRRKSYGFEKMLQPSETSSSSFGGIRIESSTDSGLGRSSDLPSNWSPTVDSPQRTIITFGDKTKPATTSISLFSNPSSNKQETLGDSNSSRPKPVPMLRRRSIEKKDELKRHSIAVDEKIDEHYQHRNSSNDRKISLVNLNGPSYSNTAVDKLPQSIQAAFNDGRQKKVEFCKTEIHFAADSGRVNIVETDEKPPPTNNFRRRRRNSGTEYSTQQQQIDFDDETERHLEGHLNAVESNVTTTIGSIYSSAKEDETDEGHSDTDGLRGILKNKPVKPKPYHLGENLESGSSLFGVRLKPVENQNTTWRHSAELESVVTGKKMDDALEDEFRNLVKAIDENEKRNTNVDHHQQQSSSSTFSSSNGYSTKINLSSLPSIQQHPAVTNNNNHKDSSSSSTTAMLTAISSHKPSTFTSYNDSRQSNGGNVTLTGVDSGCDDDKNLHQSRHKGGHKISIDLKLPHPSSMDKIMDELKSTSLIIKTMKSTSYFDDAMKQFEQESPLIRTSSLRLNNESLPKSSSTSMMFNRYNNYKPTAPVRYTSSLDGDHGILDDFKSTSSEKRDDDFDFLNGFLEENRKFQISIAQKEKEKRSKVMTDTVKVATVSEQQQPPVAAPRLKKIMNPSLQLSQQLSQLKHLYDIANYDSDDNAKADEEVKSFLSKNEEEKSISELSGSWSRVRVKKIASAFSSATASSSSSSSGDKWTKTPLTALYENATTSSVQKTRDIAKPSSVEAVPHTSTSLIHIGSASLNHEKVNATNIYTNIQQDNSVKVNIQNFESLSPALSRNNSLRIKRDNAKEETQKISTGTRQLKAHELTYFGVKSSPVTTTINSTDSNNIISTNKSPYMHLTTNNKNNITSSIKTTHTTNITNTSSKITVNHHQKPDLIMHHQQKNEQLLQQQQTELTPTEKKLMIEALDNCIDETKNLEPLYENLYQNNNNNKQPYNRKLDLKRDEKILDELTRAADEIMNTCKEMYHADSEEKKRKSLLLTSTTTCLETIKEGAEGRQQKLNHYQQQQSEHGEQPKIMKSKGVQVSRNFEDSLCRYHRMQQRTSSQSSIESLPRNSKISSSSSVAVTTRTRRIKNGESTAASTTSTTVSSNTSSRKRENGNISDGSKRTIQRVCSRERMHKSNASSSESDLPNSSTEVPRRPRRTKVLKHRDENSKNDEKKSSRTAIEPRKKTEHGTSSVSKETTRVRTTKISSSSNPNTSLSSPSQNHHHHKVNGTSSSRKSRC
ncbi:hypothetical protein PVAND_004423 [Polypedilum vanderplanki]|uniref:Uncharacterized protein n=1 Tax=Polypedilum vanderplanki TaxID=319348 RepID=A0A9J6BY32_POLVA|nr:hypothetical protein PVAND_004423 [Polypedilum vanderplanki]